MRRAKVVPIKNPWHESTVVGAKADYCREDYIAPREQRRGTRLDVKSAPPIRHIHPFAWFCAAAIVCGAIIAFVT